jgi:threonine synthase
VRAIRATHGVVEAVTDAQILEAKAVVDASGIGCEPASAAAVAGARALRNRGVIRAGDSVVAILTGHVLKDPEAVMSFHAGRSPRANRPIEIEGRLDEVAHLLRGQGRRSSL